MYIWSNEDDELQGTIGNKTIKITIIIKEWVCSVVFICTHWKQYQSNHDELSYHCFHNYGLKNEDCDFEMENMQNKYEWKNQNRILSVGFVV